MRWLFLLLASCSTAIADDKGPEVIYDTAFGSVACAGFDVGTCGVELWNCHDGARYICMLNVRKRDQ